MTGGPVFEAPVRIRDIAVASRYDISRRVAAEWLRRLHAAGIVAKVGRQFFARWSAVDAWVMAGATPVARTRRSPGGCA